MIDREDLTCWIHHSMAITGGYLGVYALLCRDDFFGNALTSNMIYIVTSLFGQNLMDVLIRIAGVLLYVAGCASTIVLSKKYHKKLYPYSLAVTGLAIIILGFLPEHMNDTPCILSDRHRRIVVEDTRNRGWGKAGLLG